MPDPTPPIPPTDADLDAIEARAVRAAWGRESMLEAMAAAASSSLDVPRLIAEVRRLREQLLEADLLLVTVCAERDVARERLDKLAAALREGVADA